METFCDKISSTGSIWSSLNALSTETPVSHPFWGPLLELPLPLNTQWTRLEGSCFDNEGKLKLSLSLSLSFSRASRYGISSMLHTQNWFWLYSTVYTVYSDDLLSARAISHNAFSKPHPNLFLVFDVQLLSHWHRKCFRRMATWRGSKQGKAFVKVRDSCLSKDLGHAREYAMAMNSPRDIVKSLQVHPIPHIRT